MEITESRRSQDYQTCLSLSVKGQRRFQIRMGSREAKTAASGDAPLTSKVLAHEIRESKVAEIDDNAKQKYRRRKKKIPKRCPLLTLSDQASTSIIVEALHDHLARIESGILDGDGTGNESTSNLNSCAFPYYRSWCRGHCQDAVLVKDACVSCTALSQNFEAENDERRKSKVSSLERKLVKQLKTEYKDLSSITRKISAYTKDILSSITTKTGIKRSLNEDTNENCSSNGGLATQPIAMQYFDKSGRPCLKLRLRDSKDSPSVRECQWFTNYRDNRPTATISPRGLRSIDEASSNCSSSSIYNYLMFTRRHASTKSD